jgi:uncharacterized RDD family membrane protein YckC
MYNVYFNAHFGGTLGKLAVGIRITQPDGTAIGWIEAWKCSSVDLAFAFAAVVAEVWALVLVDPIQYTSLGVTTIAFRRCHRATSRIAVWNFDSSSPSSATCG